MHGSYKGDATRRNWLEHRLYCARRNHSTNGNAVNLPQHGSKDDCSDQVLDHLFQTDGEKTACISTNGLLHPPMETLKLINDKNIKPYCTNLSRFCGNNLIKFRNYSSISPVLGRFIRSMALKIKPDEIQVCQGNIELNVDEAQGLNITTQYDHPCPYRGDYGFVN